MRVRIRIVAVSYTHLPAAASTEKTVITFWNGFTGTDGDVLKEIVAEYNATNTLNVEIQVEIMSWDSLYQKLATALPVGEGPDIIAYNTCLLYTSRCV